MQRDWDVIRKILLKVEELPSEHTHVIATEVEGIDEATTNYHMRLLGQAGLIVGANLDRESGRCTARKLTWKGHEFLDGIRQETAWNKIKDTLRDKSLSLSYDTIKAAMAYIAARVLS